MDSITWEGGWVEGAEKWLIFIVEGEGKKERISFLVHVEI